jgi:hypothetical protein
MIEKSYNDLPEPTRIHVGVSLANLKSELLEHWNQGRANGRDSLRKVARAMELAVIRLDQMDERISLSFIDVRGLEVEGNWVRPRPGDPFYITADTDVDKLVKEFTSWVRQEFR